jgi:hypothetical protein
MADAKKDDNSYSAWTGLSSSDGVTPVRIQVNPSNGGMLIDTTTTISFTPRNNAVEDANSVPSKMGVSSVDGVTPIPVYVNPLTGAVLVDQ